MQSADMSTYPMSSDEPSGFSFTVRTTGAAVCALLSAELLDLKHPWWAAMTVWLVTQPSRGMTRERMTARLLGSIAGAVSGSMISAIFWGNLPLMITTLGLWVMICVAAGRYFHHFRNYGLVVAGYTAGIIVMFSVMEPNTRSFLALDRIGCNLTGIIFCGLFCYQNLPGQQEKILDKYEPKLKRILYLGQSYLAGFAVRSQSAELLSELIETDNQLNSAASGSLKEMNRASTVRKTYPVLLDILAELQSPHHRTCSGQVRTPVFSSRLMTPGELSAAARQAGYVRLSRYWQELNAQLSEKRKPASPPPQWSDRLSGEVFRAAMRPVAAIGCATIIWWQTAWSVAPVMMMSAILFSALFSGSTTGNQTLCQVLKGCLCGISLGLVFLILEGTSFPCFLGQAFQPSLKILTLIPFLSLGAFLMSRTDTAKMALDLNMSFLLVTQPTFFQPALTVPDIWGNSAAILIGVVIVILVYGLFLPASVSDSQNRALLQLTRACTDIVNPASVYSDRSYRKLRTALTVIMKNDPRTIVCDSVLTLLHRIHPYIPPYECSEITDRTGHSSGGTQVAEATRTLSYHVLS
jgi:uncharacterized membrane protein YccC